MIETRSLEFYRDKEKILDKIDIEIRRGEFVAVIGGNGSGKSTLAKHFNAILIPTRGKVFVDGTDTSDEDDLYKIRERVGMVFQNPDSQAVASVVEDDTAFAPENLGLDEAETVRRVDEALAVCGISELRKMPISELSGGQRQLTAIAGVLAMRPGYMVFDESTSMLDPIARERVLGCVKELVSELGIGVIWITHYMTEAAMADRIVVINGGRVEADGRPEDIFSDTELMRRAKITPPPAARLCALLREHGIDIPTAVDMRRCAKLIAELWEARHA